MRGSRMTVQLASMGDAVMERPRRRDLARFHVRPRVRPVLGESPPDESSVVQLLSVSLVVYEGARSNDPKSREIR